LFYEFLVRCFTNNDEHVKWGMFKGQSIERPIASIIVWAAFLSFMALPFINDLCIAKFRRNYSQRLIWQ
jgi:hypothetical protein